MIKVFSLTNLNVEYITDYQGLAIFQQIQNYLLPINNGSLGNIAILDMDADKDIILSELQECAIFHRIALSSSWTLDKIITALECNCRAFLENGNLTSINDTINLVTRHKVSVFDKSVIAIINSFLI